MTSEADPGAVFVEYRPARRRWVVVGAVLGAAVLVLTLVYGLRWTVFSPATVVHGYFDALAERDGAGALEMTVAGEDAPDRELLTAAVAGEAYRPPQQVEVRDVADDGAERRRVVVAFVVDGQEHTATLELRRAEGFLDTVFQRWRIVDGVRTIPLGEVPGAVTVNGAPAGAYDLAGPRPVPALFGGHEVSVPDDDPLWEPRPVTVTVGGDDPPPAVDVPMEPRVEVREEVERQLDEILEDCVDRAELLPPDCPFGNARTAEASDVAWEITRSPTVELTTGPDGFGDVAMLVRTVDNGEAVVTGTEVAFGAEREFEIVVPFPVSGVVSVRDGAVVFEPGW